MGEEKYLATLMQKHFLGDNCFIYSVIATTEGTYSINDKTFIDDRGNTYFSILDKTLMYSEVPYSYANLIPISSLGDILQEELSYDEAVTHYENLCKQVVYLVALTRDNEVFCTPLNVTELIDRNTLVRRQQLNGNTSSQNISETVDEYDNDEEEKEFEFATDLVKLVSDIVAGNYSLKELKNLQGEITKSLEELDAVRDTLDLQIEASEKGEATVQLRSEDEYYDDFDLEEELDADQEVEEVVNPLPFDVNSLYEKISKTLIAQDEQVRRMLVSILKLSMKKHNKMGILLTGSTGTGKTKMMELMAKYVDRPFLLVDSTQLTVPGIVGTSIEQYLWQLYKDCNYDIEKAQKAIVYFDEIDKKGSVNKSDVFGKGVLNVLLKFMDGTKYTACENPQIVTSNSSVKIDTSNMIVIAGGAFNDVYKNMKQKRKLGIYTEEERNKHEKEKLVPTIEDFVEKSMMTDEFMGRVPIIVRMNDWTPETMKRLLLESDESPLTEEQECFERCGVKLTVTDEYLDALSTKACSRGFGARGLAGLVEDTTNKPFDIVSSEFGVYSEVLLDKDVFENTDSYQLVKKIK